MTATREQIVETALQEDADAGGTIPALDIPELKQLGVSELFTPGAATQDIVDFLCSTIAQAQRGARRST